MNVLESPAALLRHSVQIMDEKLNEDSKEYVANRMISVYIT